MQEKLRSRLLRLMALANSASESGLEGEAQLAASKMAELLAEHNLEMADLEQRGQAKPGVIKGAYDLKKAAFKWKLQLADSIAEYFFCHSLTDWDSNTVAFVGRPDNVESLHMLYEWLIAQIREIARVSRYPHMEETGEHVDPLRWQCGFGEGAAVRLGERLKELRERQTRDSMALVVSHSREVSDWMEENYGWRPDGRRTKRQREWDERVAQARKRREAEEARKAKLKEEDIEEFYRQYPDDHPDAVAARQREFEREVEKQRARERRNAARRVERDHKPPSKTERERRRKDRQKAQAREVGVQKAEEINLQPFLTEGEKPVEKIR